MLQWLCCAHVPIVWDQELNWLLSKSRGEGHTAMLPKLAATETIYAVWHARNDLVFNNVNRCSSVTDEVIHIVITRAQV